jgi:hypothetical protein
MILIFPFQPFSATANHPLALISLQTRFLIIPFMAGLVLASRWSPAGGMAILSSAIVVLAAWMGSRETGLVCAAMVAGAWACERFFRDALPLRRVRLLPAVTILVGVLLAGSVLMRDGIDRRIESRVFTRTFGGQDFGSLWREVNKLPDGSRIASFGLAENLTYPLFGRSFTLQPVCVDAGGKPLRPMHEEWASLADRYEWWPVDSSATMDMTGLPNELMRNGITHVVISRTRDGRWPAQSAVLVPPRFAVVWSGQGASIFRANQGI